MHLALNLSRELGKISIKLLYNYEITLNVDKFHPKRFVAMGTTGESAQLV